MSAFPNWQQFAVPQRRRETGCIPTGYEMLLRAAGIQGVNFETFQDDFDLDKNLQPGVDRRNNFSSVAEEIMRKYPQVHLKIDVFLKDAGTKKLQCVEEKINNQRLILIALKEIHEGLPGGDDVAYLDE